MASLYGREHELALVRTFLTRPEKDGVPISRPVPVLVFTGTRGSGKSALLAELADRLDQWVPHASIDCGAADRRCFRERLSAIAFELNRKCGRAGRLAFSRLVTGQVIIAQELDDNDPKLAREQAQQALASHRKVETLRNFLADTAPEVLMTLPGVATIPGISTAGRYLPDLILKGLVSWRRGRRVVLGEGQSWYGHQDRGLQLDPLDVLVELNRHAHSDIEGNQQKATQLLWAAFLADLRHDFAHGRRAAERTLNCVLLLDNIDSQEGISFLEGLRQARGQHAAFVVDDPDPLTVVATSSGELSAGTTRSIPVAEEAGYEDYLRRGQDEGKRGLYPVRLRDLTSDEVGNMVAGVEGIRGHLPRITNALTRLTHGHPASTRVLIDAIASYRADPVDLAVLLDFADATGLDANPPTVEQRLLDLFLTDLSDDAISDLTVCAAARDLDQALRLAAHSGLLTGSHGERAILFAAELWPRVEEAAGARMPGILRRLLLRRLAAGEGWSEVYSWLRTECVTTEDEAGTLHYSLALGELEFVTRRLAELLSEYDVAVWLRMLRAVTAAPTPWTEQLPQLTRVQQLLTDWAEPPDDWLQSLGRLVASLWIDCDGLGDSRRRTLFLEIGADYEVIAPYSGNGSAVLRNEAAKYRRDATLTD